MKQKKVIEEENSKNIVYFDNKIESEVSLATKKEDPNMCEAEIDMLRTGKFMRKSFFFNRIINITEEMLDNMIKNFKNNVVDTKIALDVNHMREEAYGWLTDVYKEPREINGKKQIVLKGKWDINKKGKEIMQDKIYKYFSIEFHPNYELREVDEVTKNEEGDDIPVGPMTKYGPTIIGGALTNRPFIPNLNAVPDKFSDDPKNIYMSALEEMNEDTSGELEIKLVSLKEKQPENIQKNSENSNNTSDIKASNNPEKDSKKPKSILELISFSKFKPTEPKKEAMKLTNTEKAIKFMEQELSLIEDKTSQKYKDLVENITSMKEEINSAVSEFGVNQNIIKSLKEDYNKTTTEFSSKIAALEADNARTTRELKLEAERRKQSEIETFCDKLARKGMAKPFIDKVRVMLRSENSVTAFSFKEEDKETSVSLREVIDMVVDALPASSKIATGNSFEFDMGKGEKIQEPESNKNDFYSQNAEALEAGIKAANKRNKLGGGSKRKSESDKDLEN